MNLAIWACAYAMSGALNIGVRPLTLPISSELLSRQRAHRTRRDCAGATVIETPGGKMNSCNIYPQG